MLRVPVSPLVSGELLLDRGASHYVARVHRVGAGETLVLFDPVAAREAEAAVIAVGRNGVLCRVGELRPAAAPALRSTTLLQGIGKGDKLDAVVRDATELGATRVVAVQTARTIVRLSGEGRAERGQERLARWRRIAAEAARQCGRADAPDVEGPLDWASALASAGDDRALKLCLWEHATAPIGPLLRGLGAETPLVVLIGPEGGLEPGEVTAAEELGFVTVSLGPLILRTETAATAVLGAARLLG